MQSLKLRNLMFLEKKHETPLCRDCAEFGSRACEGALPDDPACPNLTPRLGGESRLGRRSREKKKTWKLDINAEVPQTLKPCCFAEDTLTESAWLPYEDEEGNIALRPSIIMIKKGQEPQILDFLEQNQVKGTFPSQDMQSLMTTQAVQMFSSYATIEPLDIDAQIDKAIQTHLSIPKAEAILAKRWIEGTFFYDVFDAFPLENILGVSESGKSRLNLLNLSLAYHAEGVIDPTEAGIFRSKEEDKATLCIDEAEYLNNPNLHSTLRILINASYSKYAGFVTRYDETEGKRVKRRFDLYSPMSICGIGGLEGVTLSRAFRIVMKRVDRDYPKANPDTYRTLRNMLYVLRIRHAFEIRELYEKMDISDIVTARFEELFKPLFTMTKFFGNDEEWQILSEWCREYQNNFRLEALNIAEEEQTLVSLYKLEPTETDWYSIKDLTDLINMEYNRKVSNQHVSGVLRRLGLEKRKKYQGYTLVYAPKQLVEECASRLGIPISDIKKGEEREEPKPNENWITDAKEVE